MTWFLPGSWLVLFVLFPCRLLPEMRSVLFRPVVAVLFVLSLSLLTCLQNGCSLGRQFSWVADISTLSMSQIHVRVVLEAFLTFVLWSQDSRKLQGHSWLPYIKCLVFLAVLTRAALYNFTVALVLNTRQMHFAVYILLHHALWCDILLEMFQCTFRTIMLCTDVFLLLLFFLLPVQFSALVET